MDKESFDNLEEIEEMKTEIEESILRINTQYAKTVENIHKILMAIALSQMIIIVYLVIKHG